jgi:hypothetical protein
MVVAQLSVLIATLLTKPDVVQRRVSGLIGSLVADAASQHLQWIYNQVRFTILGEMVNLQKVNLSIK